MKVGMYMKKHMKKRWLKELTASQTQLYKSGKLIPCYTQRGVAPPK